MAKLKKRQGHHARCRATFISAHGEHTMINDILSRLYAHWLDTSCQRQRQIEHNARSIFKRAVPAWGLRVLIARHVLYFHFCLHFSDLKWRYSRKLASDEESIATATLMWEAYMGGYRSYKEYGYLQWLESRISPGNGLYRKAGLFWRFPRAESLFFSGRSSKLKRNRIADADYITKYMNPASCALFAP